LDRARFELKSLHGTFSISTPGWEQLILAKTYFFTLALHRFATQRDVFVRHKWSQSMQHRILIQWGVSTTSKNRMPWRYKK